MKPKIGVLITDLDNTLFDWVGLWGASFAAYLTQLSEDSGVSAVDLKTAIRPIHRKYGTSEYAFVTEEIDVLKTKFPEEDLRGRFKSAIDLRRRTYRAHLKLYPTVRETLLRIRSSGTLIVGYTESRSYYTIDRMKQLGLDGLLDALYTQGDHDLPGLALLESLRSHPAEDYLLKRTRHRYTPDGALKPNAQVLSAIMADVWADARSTVYLGDSLLKDLSMARELNVFDVLAAYGKAQDTNDYALLKEVTHWSDEEVERERVTNQIEPFVPTVTLKANFAELLQHFEFIEYRPRIISGTADRALSVGLQSTDPDPAEKRYREGLFVEAWKKTVDVQQHFNDLQLRIRTFAVAFQAALLGLVGFALREDAASRLPAGLLAIGAPAWLAFYMMDRWWYHRYLDSAVAHGRKIEAALGTSLDSDVFALTGGIKAGSPIPLGPIKKEMGSKARADVFYTLVIAFTLLGAAGLWLHSTAKRERNAKSATEAPVVSSPQAARGSQVVRTTSPEPVSVSAHDSASDSKLSGTARAGVAKPVPDTATRHPPSVPSKTSIPPKQK